MATTTNRKPTSRQLSYLRSLANRTGQTFTYPQTSRQANAEINRLKHARPSTRTERYVERKLIADQIQAGPSDAARVRDHEISGHGSSATWMHNREQARPPSRTRPRRFAPASHADRRQADRARTLHRRRRRADPLRPTNQRDRPHHRPPRRPRRARLPRRARAAHQERTRRPDRRLPPPGHQTRQPTPGHLPPRGQRMSHSNPLILQVHLPGTEPYELGDEISQQPLADAIRSEAEIIAEHASSNLPRIPGQATRAALRDRVIAEMTAALQQAGDTYTAPDGIAYTLTDQTQLDLPTRQDTLVPMRRPQTPPVIEEALGSRISRSGHPPPAAQLFAGATVPKARRWPGMTTKSSSAKATCWARPKTSSGPYTSGETATGCSPSRRDQAAPRPHRRGADEPFG